MGLAATPFGGTHCPNCTLTSWILVSGLPLQLVQMNKHLPG